MKKLFIITGAAGHLGNTLIRLLQKTDCEIRGLILPKEKPLKFKNIKYYTGDVRDKSSMTELFSDINNYDSYLIHCAGIVDISNEVTPIMYDVNVGGCENIISLCREYNVSRLVYVSSVHAIGETDKHSVLKETKQFSPESVTGGYAKTKAQATRLVLEAAEKGLDAVVVHPSGIIGPYDKTGNHLVQMVSDYIHGKLPACVKGGYDFVDVRDVARGCINAAEKGKRGECYILSNRHYEVKEVLSMLRNICGGKRLIALPMWMARAGVPIINYRAKRKSTRPLFTKYSLYTLKSNDKFSHDKATRELDFSPRDLYSTLRDTAAWICLSSKKVKVK